jgi:hypothetical protein
MLGQLLKDPYEGAGGEGEPVLDKLAEGGAEVGHWLGFSCLGIGGVVGGYFCR